MILFRKEFDSSDRDENLSLVPIRSLVQLQSSAKDRWSHSCACVCPILTSPP